MTKRIVWDKSSHSRWRSESVESDVSMSNFQTPREHRHHRRRDSNSRTVQSDPRSDPDKENKPSNHSINTVNSWEINEINGQNSNKDSIKRNKKRLKKNEINGQKLKIPVSIPYPLRPKIMVSIPLEKISVNTERVVKEEKIPPIKVSALLREKNVKLNSKFSESSSDDSSYSESENIDCIGILLKEMEDSEYSTSSEFDFSEESRVDFPKEELPRVSETKVPFISSSVTITPVVVRADESKFNFLTQQERSPWPIGTSTPLNTQIFPNEISPVVPLKRPKPSVVAESSQTTSHDVRCLFSDLDFSGQANKLFDNLTSLECGETPVDNMLINEIDQLQPSNMNDFDPLRWNIQFNDNLNLPIESDNFVQTWLSTSNTDSGITSTNLENSNSIEGCVTPATLENSGAIGAWPNPQYGAKILQNEILMLEQGSQTSANSGKPFTRNLHWCCSCDKICHCSFQQHHHCCKSVHCSLHANTVSRLDAYTQT
ncbi:uncharacterized protein LOC106663244 [Cimex lectularius]|uniref:Uncharacterized protein n=1 Tax=Cimex lectularius TaxID=79782 RepID=A0A8I6RHK4_CIMLE|nr:uncharacterized protein LOC106663244 [Cimex lectularius]